MLMVTVALHVDSTSYTQVQDALLLPELEETMIHTPPDLPVVVVLLATGYRWTWSGEKPQVPTAHVRFLFNETWLVKWSPPWFRWVPVALAVVFQMHFYRAHAGVCLRASAATGGGG